MRSLTNVPFYYEIDCAGNPVTGERHKNTRADATDFIYTIATERKQSGYVFDGLTEDGNVTINLKFEPIATNDTYNTYYNYDPVNYAGKHPSAPTLHICKDCFWIMILDSNGPYMMFDDKTLDPV